MNQASNVFQFSEIVEGPFTPERYHLVPENQRGSLKIGRKRHPLVVTELSACEFRGIIHPELASKMTTHSVYALRVMDGEWQVTLKDKSFRPDGLVNLELEQVEEIPKTALPRRSWFGGSRSISLSSNDPIVAMAIILATVLTVMIVPSLGGRWGTSQWITVGIQSLWQALIGFFRS